MNAPLRLCLTALAAVAVVVTSGGLAGAAESDLALGAVVRHTTENKTLTSDDRARLRAVGFPVLHAGAVILHKIPMHEAAQLARLQELAHSLSGFAPSGVCDQIVSKGDGVASCIGTVDGPLGSVPIRTQIGARFADAGHGAYRLTLQNVQPIEAKSLLSWSRLVKTNDVKVVIDLVPASDGWLVRTLLGVEMDCHEGSAEKVAEAMLKIDAWLSNDLARL